MTYLAAAFALAIGGFFWLRTRQRPKVGTGRPEQPAAAQFAGVELHCRADACAAAKALRGQRVLAADASALPLPDCDAARCECRYRKRTDRREDSRRSEDVGLTPLVFAASDRRDGPDRRQP
jgi:hypothetical protein